MRGALPIAIEARGRKRAHIAETGSSVEKISRMVVPEANAKEAAMVGGVEVYPVRSLLDVIHFVNSGNGILPIKPTATSLCAKPLNSSSTSKIYGLFTEVPRAPPAMATGRTFAV